MLECSHSRWEKFLIKIRAARLSCRPITGQLFLLFWNGFSQKFSSSLNSSFFVFQQSSASTRDRFAFLLLIHSDSFCTMSNARIFLLVHKKSNEKKYTKRKKLKKNIRNRVLQARVFTFLVNLCTTRALHTFFFFWDRVVEGFRKKRAGAKWGACLYRERRKKHGKLREWDFLQHEDLCGCSKNLFFYLVKFVIFIVGTWKENAVIY